MGSCHLRYTNFQLYMLSRELPLFDGGYYFDWFKLNNDAIGMGFSESIKITKKIRLYSEINGFGFSSGKRVWGTFYNGDKAGKDTNVKYEDLRINSALEYQVYGFWLNASVSLGFDVEIEERLNFLMSFEYYLKKYTPIRHTVDASVHESKNDVYLSKSYMQHYIPPLYFLRLGLTYDLNFKRKEKIIVPPLK